MKLKRVLVWIIIIIFSVISLSFTVGYFFIETVPTTLFATCLLVDDNTKIQNSSTTKDRIDITATEKFSLSDYRWGITEFPANEVLSKIESSQDLIEKGKQLWREKLNFTPSKDYIIKTYYDDKNDCWMVTAEIEDIETDYAIPTAIIYTNGIVAAVWRE